jgi:outer membrane protein, heavy metal efflux system
MKQIKISIVKLGAVCIVLLAGCATRQIAKRESQISADSSNDVAAVKSQESSTEIRELNGVLTLRDALALALTENPELATFGWETRANEARLLQAGLRHNPELALQVEDVLGTGDFTGGREAQTTLQLSQVIELGSKRSARIEAASQARGVTQSAYELKRVEILGEVTRRFIQVVANQYALDLALTNRQLSADALKTVQERVTAGKASTLEERKAEVAFARGEVLVEGAKHDLSAARKKLSASWQNTNPGFERADADLFIIKPIPSFDELTERLSKSPEIAQWISEKKLREAEIRLAEAKRVPNVTVAGGVRRLEGPNEQALVFSFSMPLQLFDRNQGGVAETRALRGKTEAEQKAAEARLSVVLVGLYEEMAHDVHVMEALQKEILPKAKDALAIAEEGYRQGRFSFLEVLDAQRTLFDIKQESIQTATSYHQFLVEMERLLGQPIDSKLE